jgi:hypothetical protein
MDHRPRAGQLREQFFLVSPEIAVVDAVFDDLEAVLGESADPTPADIAELTPRLHAVFRRIAYVAQEPNSGVRPETIAGARNFLDQRFPRDFLPARAHLRRLAMTVENLLDELLEDMP